MHCDKAINVTINLQNKGRETLRFNGIGMENFSAAIVEQECSVDDSEGAGFLKIH